ncbi:hypothetical protein B296_00041135 [Ensete ventricosum]|uniref:Uncharacterized protein n=1 Tax=Ensete ventricosum TaxID=4639 RepID=A0A426XGI0_ENSVE|nr:hypothetical protein B296_00041135 [Ensete ventricosum]
MKCSHVAAALSLDCLSLYRSPLFLSSSIAAASQSSPPAPTSATAPPSRRAPVPQRSLLSATPSAPTHSSVAVASCCCSALVPLPIATVAPSAAYSPTPLAISSISLPSPASPSPPLPTVGSNDAQPLPRNRNHCRPQSLPLSNFLLCWQHRHCCQPSPLPSLSSLLLLPRFLPRSATATRSHTTASPLPATHDCGRCPQSTSAPICRPLLPAVPPLFPAATFCP